MFLGIFLESEVLIFLIYGQLRNTFYNSVIPIKNLRKIHKLRAVFILGTQM